MTDCTVAGLGQVQLKCIKPAVFTLEVQRIYNVELHTTQPLAHFLAGQKFEPLFGCFSVLCVKTLAKSRETPARTNSPQNKNEERKNTLAGMGCAVFVLFVVCFVLCVLSVLVRRGLLEETRDALFPQYFFFLQVGENIALHLWLQLSLS